MSQRRRGREAALQLLYASDLESELDSLQDPGRFWSLCTAKPSGRAFAEELVAGVLQHLAEIDDLIRGSVENFEFHRLAAVDRNLLRLAAFEIRFSDSGIPSAVVINEAVEIAKAFGNPDSPRFVNGVLDRIRKDFESSASL